jgi:hypothetical protein
MVPASKFRRVIVCLVLAAGFGALWGFGAGGLSTYVISLMSGPRITESIWIQRDGMPLIETRIGNDYDARRFRTLEGNEVEEDRIVDSLSWVTMDKPHRSAGLVHWPMEWRNRIAVTADSRKPPTFWAVVRDAGMPGHVYLAGYDSLSDQNVGYLGREGLRPAIPPKDEWFDVGFQTVNYDSNAIVPAGYMNWGGSFSTNYRQVGEGHFQPWTLFICDGNTVRQIDLRDREVRTIAAFDDLVGVEIVQVDSVQTPVDAQLARTENRLLVRSAERLVLYNTFDSSQVEFKIPAGLENERFRVDVLSQERLLLHTNRGYWERGSIVELLTITPSGEVEHGDTLKLVNYVPPKTQEQSLQVASIAPVLLLWVVGMLLVAPLINIQNLRADTFQQGLDQAVEGWPGLLIVAVISTILTAIVYRWQKKYSRPNTALWTTFVFLTTLPGFFAYWAMHRREPMGACVHCGASVPQDRDVCAHCAAPLPEAKLLGTEILT